MGHPRCSIVSTKLSGWEVGREGAGTISLPYRDSPSSVGKQGGLSESISPVPDRGLIPGPTRINYYSMEPRSTQTRPLWHHDTVPVSSGGFSLAENPASSVATLASTYLSGGPVRSVTLQSEHHPQSPSPSRTAPSSLPPPDVPLSLRHLSAYPPASQPVRVSDRPRPAIPMPGPGHYESHTRRYPSDLPPSRVQRSVAMPLPNDTRVDYDLGYERYGDKDEDDHDTLEMHRSGALSEDPSNRPVFELWGSSIAGIQISEVCSLSETICMN
ncbi:hypothetical protein EDB92DRAFT_1820823 [Lactarius akahatsu]|uniref:Uncharacterized protein n=1 Tax=Lactarius akahatsu TaxID=416441 RepID=A0AAD4L9Q8_9AGAM|nr:hypothetical protein EDB92DRAFT_1820823 [Lactarius akahatsu]